MSLNDLYLLRILQLDVYINTLMRFKEICEDYRLKKVFISNLDKYLEERKQIRRFLNMIELWRLEKC